MADRDLGEATIVYEHPKEGTVEETVQNEHLAYFQDHWLIRLREDEAGNDVVRRIPHGRVHYVERNVEEFQEEVAGLRNRVESLADEVRSAILGSGEESRGTRIEVSSGEEESTDESAAGRDR